MFSRTVWAWSNLDNFLNFTDRDLHRGSAKFGLVKIYVVKLYLFVWRLKFSIFKVRVSATQICKFERKNDKAKYREMDLRVAT